MPEPTKQFYLIKVSKMCTSDEADLVSSWSAVVAEEDLHKLSMATAGEATGLSLKDCPIDGIRPMTEAEIAAYRGADSAD